MSVSSVCCVARNAARIQKGLIDIYSDRRSTSIQLYKSKINIPRDHSVYVIFKVKNYKFHL